GRNLRWLWRLGNPSCSQGWVRFDRRACGIEDDALRPLPVGLNSYDGTVGASRLGAFGNRQGRQGGVNDKEKRKQPATDKEKITNNGHPTSLPSAGRCDHRFQLAISLLVPSRGGRFNGPRRFRAVLDGKAP